MDYHFKIKFKDYNDLLVKLNDIDLARDYMALFHRNYQKQFPILRDLGSYNISRMQDLAKQAKDLLNWDWLKDDYSSLEVTTRMHKDIEHYVSKGFQHIDSSHDSLLHELHYCLHSMQVDNRRGSVQIEWFNDDGFSLDPYKIKFSHDNTLGAIQLQNPYVGHAPDWVYQQNDYTDVWSTCKFHNFVRPGFVIQMQGTIHRSIHHFDVDAYLAWWWQHAPDFIEYHGVEKMKAYAGKPIIGYVINNKELLNIHHAGKLELVGVEINPEYLLTLSDTNLPDCYAVSKHDYLNVAGPDWPSYEDFLQDKNVPEFIKKELTDMLS
jgi:hypothetical protein